MARQTTMENIITLVTLRFIGQSVNSKKIAEFLGITRRHANNIIRLLEKQDFAKRNKHGEIEIYGTTDKGLKVIANIMRYIADLVEGR